MCPSEVMLDFYVVPAFDWQRQNKSVNFTFNHQFLNDIDIRYSVGFNFYAV